MEDIVPIKNTLPDNIEPSIFEMDLCNYLYRARYETVSEKMLPLSFKMHKGSVNNREFVLGLLPNGYEQCELLAELNEENEVIWACICSGYVYFEIHPSIYLAEVSNQQRIAELIEKPEANEDYWSTVYNLSSSIGDFVYRMNIMKLKMLAEMTNTGLPMDLQSFAKEYKQYCDALHLVRRSRINASEFGLKHLNNLTK